MAEVRCLRAMWAYDLYDLYGTVPLITDPDIALDPQKAQSYMPERPSIEWYVNFIDTELKEAEENLKPASLLGGKRIWENDQRYRSNVYVETLYA